MVFFIHSIILISKIKFNTPQIGNTVNLNQVACLETKLQGISLLFYFTLIIHQFNECTLVSTQLQD